jgi:predicted AAA+ superfamily ATPase
MKHRRLYKDLVDHLDKKELTILTGARQTGKSTLLRQLEEHCNNEGIPAVFINLEHKPILFELNNNPLNLLKFLPGSVGRTVILIDEVQYLDDPSNFLKLLYDEHAGRIKIIASGSSAFYLDKRFKDSMAGRKRIFRLLTCSFYEYLELSEKMELLEELTRLTTTENTKSTKLDYLRLEWEEFMIFGGYPAVITESNREDKIIRLRELRDSFVKRDIQESGVSNETEFYQLFRILALQSGNLVNLNELSSTLNIKNETVKNYMTVMQKCFHIALIRPFFRNLRKELVKMPKVFFMDSGMRNCLIDNFQSPEMRIDKGILWENSFFRLLAERYDLDSIKYWRTTAGNEIDFVLPEISDPIAFEVKYSKTHVRSAKYRLFKQSYPEIRVDYAYMNPFSEDFFRTNF